MISKLSEEDQDVLREVLDEAFSRSSDMAFAREHAENLAVSLRQMQEMQAQLHAPPGAGCDK